MGGLLDFLMSIVNFVKMIVESIINFFSLVGNAISYLTQLLGYMPSFLIATLTGILLIFVVKLIVGR